MHLHHDMLEVPGCFPRSLIADIGVSSDETKDYWDGAGLPQDVAASA